jgi:thiol-disulfide isomerase/thioredoxin
MLPRSVFVVAALAVVACRGPTEPAAAPEQPVARSQADAQQQVTVTGRIVRGGLALPGVRVSYGLLPDDDAIVSDEAGEFRLVVDEEFARAPALYLYLITADNDRFAAVLLSLGGTISASFDVSGPLRVDASDGNIEQQAWLDVRAWAEREASEWLNTAKDDHAAQLAQWARIAEAIAAEPDQLRRSLMTVAQFHIGRGQPEAGLDRSAIARAALDELGLDDPRWAMYPWTLLVAVHESGRWHQLAPRLDALISEHPQPDVAAMIVLERYFQTSTEGPASEAEAIWQRWLDRPTLARTGVGRTIASLGPKRPLAPGQSLPELCAEDLDGGPLCLADLRGRVVVLELWSTWCQGCQKMAAKLRAAHSACSGDDAPLFVSIDVYDPPEQLAEFLRGEPMPWRHGWVVEGEREGFREALGVESIPTLVLVDAKGTIVASTPELEAEQLLERIEALRREPI